MDKLPDYADWLTKDRFLVEQKNWEIDQTHCQLAKEVVDLCDTDIIKTMVEVGCGSGVFASYLPNHIKYVGLDKNEFCINACKLLNPHENKVFVQADIRTVRPVRVDLAFCLSTLKHFDLDEWPTIAAKIINMGRTAMFTMSIASEDKNDGVEFPHTWITLDTLNKVLGEINHELISMRTMWNGGEIGSERLFITKRKTS